MPASFLDLPAETLGQIFGHFQTIRPTPYPTMELQSLNKTCRAFRAVTEPMIYQDIVITESVYQLLVLAFRIFAQPARALHIRTFQYWGQPFRSESEGVKSNRHPNAEPWVDKRKAKSFEYFDQKPRFLPMLRAELDAFMTPEDADDAFQDVKGRANTDLILLAVLIQAKNMEKLDISTVIFPGGLFERYVSKAYAEGRAFTSLRNVVITNVASFPEDVLDDTSASFWLCHPPVRKLDFDIPTEEDKPEGNRAFHMLDSKCSSVEEIQISETGVVRFRDLEKLFQACRSVTSFSHCFDLWHFQEQLSSTDLVRVLSDEAPLVEHLDITANANDAEYWCDPDQLGLLTPLRLDRLRCLRRLSIDDNMLFGGRFIFQCYEELDMVLDDSFDDMPPEDEWPESFRLDVAAQVADHLPSSLETITVHSVDWLYNLLTTLDVFTRLMSGRGSKFPNIKTAIVYAGYGGFAGLLRDFLRSKTVQDAEQAGFFVDARSCQIDHWEPHEKHMCSLRYSDAQRAMLAG